MNIYARILIGLVAAIHLYILWFEMFAWESRGPIVFSGLPKDLFSKTTAMAANQGVYNGFLAAGLIWSLIISDPVWRRNVAMFFLACVGVAGLYGAATVTQKTLLVQTLPAVAAMAALFFRK